MAEIVVAAVAFVVGAALAWLLRDAKVAALETRLAEERKAAAEKLSLLNGAQRALSNAFKALSADALKSNNQGFLDLARAQLGEFQEGARSDLEARKSGMGSRGWKRDASAWEPRYRRASLRRGARYCSESFVAQAGASAVLGELAVVDSLGRFQRRIDE